MCLCSCARTGSFYELKIVITLSRALPLLVWHRQNWSILHPYVHMEDEELERLSSSITYVAGFTDASVENRTELYDLFVNGKSWKLIKSPHCYYRRKKY